MSGRRFTIGNKKDRIDFDAPAGLSAKILSVYGGWYVDSITFEIFPTPVVPQIPSGTRFDLTLLVHQAGPGDLIATGFAGSRGQSRRLEGFQILPRGLPNGVSFSYSAHLEGSGDVSLVTDGSFIGTRGQSRRLEGFTIFLTGPEAAKYDLLYFAHLAGTGDTAVATAGQFVGTKGQSRAVEGMQVWLVRK